MKSKEVKMPNVVITDEMIAEMRGKIGLKLNVESSIFNEQATRMAIMKFANGIGDSNPLWTDKEYSLKTRYGSIIAPPSWVWSVLSGIQFGWRGLAGFHSGSDIEFYKPVFLNDRIDPEYVFTGFDGPKPSKFAERMVINHYECEYTNQRNELVARAKSWVIKVERAKARGRHKYSDIVLPHPWTEYELEKIEKEVLSDRIRGSTIRYWEDVNIGEDLEPLVKGPLGMTDMIAFIIGGGAPIPRLAANSVQLRLYRKHPAWTFRDSDTCALEPIFAVHYNKKAANEMGVPYPYDVGIQRHCWQIQLLTNWIGDDGWLKRSYAEYRNFVYHSDVIWLRGKVMEKYIDEDGECCLKIQTQAINQRGENVLHSYATVVLPSRDKKISPLDSRLR